MRSTGIRHARVSLKEQYSVTLELINNEIRTLEDKVTANKYTLKYYTKKLETIKPRAIATELYAKKQIKKINITISFANNRIIVLKHERRQIFKEK